MKAVTTVLTCALACACDEGTATPEGMDASMGEQPTMTSDPATASDLDAGPSLDASITCVAPALRMPELDAQVMRLSELGLYSDIASKQLACDLLTWRPRFPLWSDAAEKSRYVRLPANIDSSDPDHYRFPVGTVLFKEFALDHKRLETRVVARISEEQTFYGAFAWRDDESDADLVPRGAQDVRGTDHDIPDNTQCVTCHMGEPGHVLGLSAVQVPDFTHVTHAVPELGVAAAPGYLHGNCGHCHSPTGNAWRQTDMTLRLSVLDGPRALLRTITQPASTPKLGRTMRVVAGDPDASLILARMQTRATEQMPPIATEHVDPQGVAEVRAWIAGLSGGSGP